MNGLEFREKLHSGVRLYGTLIASDSPRWPQVVMNMGLDFVFIDTEHIALDRHSVSWMCQTYAALGLPPVVRISRPDPYLACQILDGGARGIIAPYVESAEEVRQLVGAVKYRPLKGKILQSLLSGERALEPDLAAYLAEYNQNNSLIVNIESTPALQALDEILAVPGLDGTLVGPHDLTTNLGIPEQYEHPAYIAAVDEIVRKSRARSIGVGTHVMYSQGISQEILWAHMGANLIVHWADTNAFLFAMQSSLAEIKSALGDVPAAKPSQDNAI
jgi:2-keto-3-deoxy-L-rhamnonate aldolase RhmA